MNVKNQIKSSDQLCLCSHLEAIVGQYEMIDIGTSDIEVLYHDSNVGIYDPVPLTRENIVAYFLMNEHIAFVESNMLQQLRKDTEGYKINFIEVKSFDAEILCRNELSFLEQYFNKIAWIDDDFMNDESIEFDSNAFDVIDSGTKYLNPKHFSVEQLVTAYKSTEN